MARWKELIESFQEKKSTPLYDNLALRKLAISECARFCHFWPLFRTMSQIAHIKLFTGWSDFNFENGTEISTSRSSWWAKHAKIFVRAFLDPIVDRLLMCVELGVLPNVRSYEAKTGRKCLTLKCHGRNCADSFYSVTTAQTAQFSQRRESDGWNPALHRVAVGGFSPRYTNIFKH